MFSVGISVGLPLLLPASITSTNAQECFPAPEGLVAWWPGDGNTTDIQGSNHGTLQNGATFATGQVGDAFSLDGVDDYIDVGQGFNLDAMTLDAWVFIDPVTNIGHRRIISKDNVGLNGPRKLFTLKTSAPNISGNDGRAAFGVCASVTGDTCAPNVADAIEAPTALTAGWHHLAAVRDPAAGRFELYVDGVRVASKPGELLAASGPVDSVANTVIGQVGPQYNGEFFQGLIDEVEIYNRGLSASEIQAIFDAGAAGKCKDEDGDGFRPPEDCNETDAEINPNAVELPGNFVDENCNGDLGSCSPCMAWRNHGEYVRCVANDVESLVTAGVLSQEEGDALVGSAAQSDVGRRGFVPAECQ